MAINDPRKAPSFSTVGLTAQAASAVNTINNVLLLINSGVKAHSAMQASDALNNLSSKLRELLPLYASVKWRTTGDATSADSVSAVQRTGAASQRFHWYAVDHKALRDEHMRLPAADVQQAVEDLWFYIVGNIGKRDVRPSVDSFWLLVSTLRAAL